MRLPPFRGSTRPAGAVRINTDSPQAHGLKVWYPLSPACPIANLASGRQAGTAVGTQAYVGNHDVGLVWSGNGSSRAIATNIALSAVDLTRCTVSAWVRPLATARGEILSTEGSGSDGMSLVTNALGGFDFGVWNGGYGPMVRAGAYTLGAAVLLTGTRAGDSDSLRLYVNGVEVGSDPSETTPTVTTSPTLQIGRYYTGANWFNGDIWDARVYTRCLSAAEVAHLYAPETRWDLYAPA